jgi:hypothetical protein
MTGRFSVSLGSRAFVTSQEELRKRLCDRKTIILSECFDNMDREILDVTTSDLGC